MKKEEEILVRGYLDNFFSFPGKHELWVLIESSLPGTASEYHNICFHKLEIY